MRPLVLLLLVLSWLLSMLGTSPLHAQSPDTLTGQVVNGTEGGAVPPELEITLRFWDTAGEAQARETRTGNGIFSFSGLPVAGAQGYRLEAIYQGVLYAQEAPAPWTAEPVALTVYETAAEVSLLTVLDATLVITQGKPDQQLLGVLEVIRLENPSDRTFLSSPAESGPMDLLRFSLAPQAAGLDVQTFLEAGHLVQVDRGFALTTPILPGRHDILFTYQSPYGGDEWSYDRGFPYGAGVFRVMVADKLGQAQGTGLQELVAVTVGTQRYTLLEARDIPPGERVQIELRGLPQPPLWRRVANSATIVPLRRALVPTITGGVLLALLVFSVASSRTRVAARAFRTGALLGSHVQERKERLVEAIARLDLTAAQEKADEAEYQESREALMGQLRLLAQAEEKPQSGAASSNKSEPG